jgi:hypothetical protein
VGDLERLAGVLLDEEHGRAAPVDRLDSSPTSVEILSPGARRVLRARARDAGRPPRGLTTLELRVDETEPCVASDVLEVAILLKLEAAV